VLRLGQAAERGFAQAGQPQLVPALERVGERGDREIVAGEPVVLDEDVVEVVDAGLVQIERATRDHAMAQRELLADERGGAAVEDVELRRAVGGQAREPVLDPAPREEERVALEPVPDLRGTWRARIDDFYRHAAQSSPGRVRCQNDRR
jgi:hypothetical protein